jgi:hypothetical protein
MHFDNLEAANPVRHRRFKRVADDNDRSPEVAAMNAHLRVSAYGQGGRSSRPTYDLEASATNSRGDPLAAPGLERTVTEACGR